MAAPRADTCGIATEHLAVDEPGALVMADRPVQPWSHMACRGTPRLNSHHPHSVLVLLGDSESTTHGPWRRPSHFVLLCRARTPESQPHSHTPTSVCAVRHLPRPHQLKPKDRAGSVPSVHSMLSQHSAAVSLSSSRGRQCLAVRLARSPSNLSHRPALLVTDRCDGDSHASSPKLRLLIRTFLGAVQLSLLGLL